ncbi:MAG: DDE-type integrase/transposase/recombinase [candidate division Zixibacteria bacterium]|nr:DDE-type integrase/transposase/recombinase [candidate division Zixibacteria bacterium]
MRWPSSYLRMKVLGAIDYAQGTTIIERIKKVSEQAFIDEDGNPRKFTWRTISTWLYRYKHDGITGVKTKQRLDKGKTRKITPEELLEAINQVLPLFRKDRKYNKTAIYRACIEKGILSKTQIAVNTFSRLVNEYELLKDDVENNKKRLAFAMQYANQLWQADTMYGPHVKNDHGKAVQTKLICFIDDASRVLCHGQFFFQENVDSMVTAMKAAFYKRGIPEQLYVDNGPVYTSQEITLICARVGCILRHSPLRDGAAKGKIERFFRGVRSSFLCHQLDLSSLEKLNRLFSLWVEDEYNSTIHSAIGMKPIDRFGLDLNRIRFLPPDEVNDELFFAEATRKVRKDNTFPFRNKRYETPTDLRDKKVTIRFNRHAPDRLVVYYKNHRMGKATELDLVFNAMLRNKKYKKGGK